MKTVFISRPLAPDSPIRAFAEEMGWRLCDESLLEFQPLHFERFPAADWVFFYSKKAVHFFFSGLKRLGIKGPGKIAVMGPGTLKALKPFGKAADFAGNGTPERVAAAFAVLAQGERVLFPRARRSRKSVQNLLQDQVEVLDLVVYDNAIRHDLDLPRPDFLLFTSPLNVEAYLAKYSLSTEQAVIAIGHTTGGALEKAGVQHFQVADQPSEAGMLRTLRALVG